MHGRQVTLYRGLQRVAMLSVLGLLPACAEPQEGVPAPEATAEGGVTGGGYSSASGSGGATSGGASAVTGGAAQAGAPSTTGGNSAADSSGGSGVAGGSGGTSGIQNCKRGLAAPGAALTNPAIVPGVAWWYNWDITRQGLAAGLEFVPMVWGSGALADAASKVPAGARFLLGFNEPNFFAQSNLSAQAAAQLWPQIEAVAKAKNLELVSPAVNYCGDDASKTGPCHDTNPVSYLEEFFAACSNCQVDYVAVHWYNCSVPELQFYLGQFRRFNKPIWLTELACAYGGDTSVAGQEAYMRAAIPILEADARVHRYAWFSGMELPSARLLEPNGELTPLGTVYAALPRGAGCNKVRSG